MRQQQNISHKNLLLTKTPQQTNHGHMFSSLLFYPIQNQTLYCLLIIIIQLIIIQYQKRKKRE